ncbi:MAG: NAD-dependent epimerase/dehydratase family protein [Pseudomonadota bacterium]
MTAASSKRIFVTGTAGFIGFHLARRLLADGHTVHGYDGMTDYYDLTLKEARQGVLSRLPGFKSTTAMLEDRAAFDSAIDACAPDLIIHLAAQAGVRYSIENPRAYVDANLMGSFNVIEGARRHAVSHLLMASTSSVYGANTQMPFSETHKADTPMTIYAATKKATEGMGHAYAHLYDLPTTMFRFFTVYGPWGRPDMAPFKFTKAILEGRPIDVYNHGQMRRDFTYIDDLVRAIVLLIDAPPERGAGDVPADDSLSPVAPFRIVNIGNSRAEPLLDFIDAIEAATGIKAKRHMMDMQPGEVTETWADATLLERLTGYKPQTDMREGVARFVTWYRDFYRV